MTFSTSRVSIITLLLAALFTGLSFSPASANQNSMEAANKAYAAGDFKEAHRIWLFNAGWGDPLAQTNVGAMYFMGKGTEKSLMQAVKWHRKSAVQDHALGQANLAECYEKGDGVRQDLREALRLYQKSAAQGHEKGKAGVKRVQALINTSNGAWPDKGDIPLINASVSDGSTASQAGNHELSYKIFKHHAEAGDPLAQTFLGYQYDHGEGTYQSYLMGAYWHEKSALQLHPFGQGNLGDAYEKGLGVPVDLKKALSLYKKSLAQGVTQVEPGIKRVEALLKNQPEPTPKFTWLPQSSKEAVQAAKAYSDHTGYAVVGWSLTPENFEDRVKKTTLRFLDVSSVKDVIVNGKTYKQAILQYEYLRDQRFAIIGDSGGQVYRSEQRISLFDCPANAYDTWSYRRYGGSELTGELFNDALLGPRSLKFETYKPGTIGHAILDAVCNAKYVYKPAK